MNFVSGRDDNTEKRPNIIFIMADDLGYADLSCYGRRDYETPNCDRLAREGIRFTHAYANSAVCSATRTALITGRYQYRLPIGLEEPLTNRPVGLPPSHPTLPSLLRQSGYKTALVGKWHLGALPDYGPLKSGYDSFYGIRGGGVDYFAHANTFGKKDLWDGAVSVDDVGYLTTLLGDRAVQTVNELSASDDPYFLSMHFTAPHWPWETENDLEESRRITARKDFLSLVHFDGGTLQTYAKMVAAMDHQVGRVLEAVKKTGGEDNTIIVFTSDNGGERFSDNWPFTGVKTELLEGGVRVPAILKWPSKLKKRQTSDQVIITMDWAPTLLSAAGVSPAPDYPSDGENIFDLLGDEPTSRDLFWRYRHFSQQAHRSGNWKYLKMGENTFLFNVVNDPLERANLKDREPEIFARLTTAYEKWNATMLPEDPDAFTHGFRAGDLADHMGVQ